MLRSGMADRGGDRINGAFTLEILCSFQFVQLVRVVVVDKSSTVNHTAR